MSRVLVLTGMHRSATSLIASLFQGAGVNLGAQLLQANSQNPLGFFEDVEFYDFHERALAARGQNILVDRAFAFAPTADEGAQADLLIASRSGYALWGWKDPRTTLFLEFWRARLPDAHFLLVYRHPLDVLLSLMRRNDWLMLGLLNALEAWYAYNQAIVEFQAQYPAQTLLCSSYSVIDQIDTFKKVLSERFGLELNLDATMRDAHYQPNELRRTPLTRSTELILEKVHPEAAALYAQLNKVADLPDTFTPDDRATTPALRALAQFASTLEQPDIASRRGLLFALLGMTQADTLEDFVQRQTQDMQRLWTDKKFFAEQSAAWEQTARAREQVILDQQRWMQERMTHLEQLEAHPVVRALKRFGSIE